MAEPLKFTLHDAQRLEPLTDLVQRITGTSPHDHQAIRERVGRLAALCGLPYDPDSIPRPPAVIERRGEDRADSGELPHPMGVAWPTPQVNALGINAHNVFTHRGSWRLALIIAREFADPHAAPDGNGHDDRAYWDHELRAFDATFSELTGQETETFTKAWGPAEQEAIRAATALKNAPQVERQRVLKDLATMLGLDVARPAPEMMGMVMALKSDNRADFVEALRRALGAEPGTEPNDLLETAAMLATPARPPIVVQPVASTQGPPPLPNWGPVRIGADVANPNNRRLYIGAGEGQQWAKVYGQDPEMADARAIIIRDAIEGQSAAGRMATELQDVLRFHPGTAWTWEQLLDGVRELSEKVDQLAAAK